MTRLAWAVPFLVLAACAAYATRALRGRQPPRERARLGLRERAAWHAIARRYGSDSREEERAAAAMEADIDRLGRQLREHLGLEGGGT